MSGFWGPARLGWDNAETSFHLGAIENVATVADAFACWMGAVMRGQRCPVDVGLAFCLLKVSSCPMSQPPHHHQRLHDLDALRAAAMLIGIVYHASLSFAAGFPWMVQDVAQAEWAFVFQGWVHGFRMQLFMLVSGFFTAMLWRQKGLKALLWHRCRRVLFPCLLGLVTVVPAMSWAVGYAMSHGATSRASAPVENASANLWAAIQLGDRKAVEAHLDAGAGLTNLHPTFVISPLQWAALNNQRELVTLLLDRGTPVDIRSRDGHTALHGAAFFGYAEVTRILLERGADPNGASNDGETPLKSAEQDWSTVQFISGILGLKVDQALWKEGRERVQVELKSRGAKTGLGVGAAANQGGKGVWTTLVNTPVFALIWFLWFLVWLVGMFSIYAVAAGKLGWRCRPHWLVLSPGNLLWLVPLTIVPTAMMEYREGIGPDTSMGVIPMPHVLLYYAIFFFFGVVYYDCDDRQGVLGGGWRWMMPLTLLVMFPLAMEFATGLFGFRDRLLPAAYHRSASVLFQAAFAWMMSFGSIGMFRALLTRENHVIRYLSDSSYWLYLAHLPLCIVVQSMISRWVMPVWIKLPVFALLLTGFLLLTYHYLIRYTWVGRLLNGPRKRRNGSQPAAAAAGGS